jgi:hypothetical protein
MKTLLLMFTASLALIAVPNFNRASAGDDSGRGGISLSENRTLSLPRFPRDFQWEGRYIVSDLVPPVDVPFTWQGDAGNGQMIAGGWRSSKPNSSAVRRKVLYVVRTFWAGGTSSG